ncbi:VCBS repeat-containing protein, partial [Sinobacterium caligoides]
MATDKHPELSETVTTTDQSDVTTSKQSNNASTEGLTKTLPSDSDQTTIADQHADTDDAKALAKEQEALADEKQEKLDDESKSEEALETEAEEEVVDELVVDEEEQSEVSEEELVNRRSNSSQQDLINATVFSEATAGFDTEAPESTPFDFLEEDNLPAAEVLKGGNSSQAQEDIMLVSQGSIGSSRATVWQVENNGEGEFGQLTVSGNGNWSFELANDNLNVQELAPGEVLSQTFVVSFADDFGRVISTEVTVSVVGTNDAPQFVGDSEGLLEESNVLGSSGQLNIVDVDASDQHSISFTDHSSDYGQFFINQDGAWRYELNESYAVESLSTGETITEQYPVTVTDRFGASNTEIITITITGSNDLPVIDASSVVSGAVAETEQSSDNQETLGSTLTSTGQMQSSDIDAQQGGVNDHRWQVLENDNLGTLTIDPITGQWHYSLANDLSEVQQLGQGETLTETFQVSVDDGEGGVATETVTITITGSNDAPFIDAESTLSGYVEADTAETILQTGGQLQSSDTDTGIGGQTNHQWAIVDGDNRVGELTINPDTGEWSYQVDKNAAEILHLSTGQTFEESFVVSVDDGHGGVTTETITVTIVATNEQPIIESSSVTFGDVHEDVSQDSSDMLTSQGGMVSSDSDSSIGGLGSHTWSVIDGNDSNIGNLSIDPASGEWVYQIANSDSQVQQLGVGETFQESFIVQVDDGLKDGKTTQVITITVTGTNDVPVIEGSSQLTGDVVEDDNASTLSTSGQMVSSDVDADDSLGGLDDHTWSVVADPSSTNLGSLTIDENTGEWTYEIDNGESQVQQLGAGDTFTESFTVQVDDGQGGITTEIVTVTVTGTNDVPVIEGSSQITGNVVEEADTTTLTTSGQMVSSDIDADSATGGLNDHSWSVITDPSSSNIGSLSIDADTGEWTYTIANSESQVQQLGVGESFEEQFTVQVDDGQGGITTEIVTVTVTGTNDVPVIEGSSQLTGDVVEDDNASTLTTSGQMVSSDVDADDSLGGLNDHTWSVIADPSNTNLGSLAIDENTGEWTYEIDNGESQVQQLGAGDTFTESFTVQVDDGQGGITTEIVTVTVTGTNDVPVIEGSSQITGSVTEDDDPTLSTSGQMVSSDIDADSA